MSTQDLPQRDLHQGIIILHLEYTTPLSITITSTQEGYAQNQNSMTSTQEGYVQNQNLITITSTQEGYAKAKKRLQFWLTQ